MQINEPVNIFAWILAVGPWKKVIFHTQMAWEFQDLTCVSEFWTCSVNATFHTAIWPDQAIMRCDKHYNSILCQFYPYVATCVNSGEVVIYLTIYRQLIGYACFFIENWNQTIIILSKKRAISLIHLAIYKFSFLVTGYSYNISEDRQLQSNCTDTFSFNL